jgi:hypothetical protein
MLFFSKTERCLWIVAVHTLPTVSSSSTS